jgi:carbon storage regulator
MLVLARKLGETLVIDGNITVKVVHVQGNTVRLGIEAPKQVPVHRAEIQQRFESAGGRASSCVA